MTDDGADERFIAQELRRALDLRDDLDQFGAYIENDDLRDVLVKLSAGWSSFSSSDSPDRFEDTEVCRLLLRMYGDRRLLSLLDGENNVALSFLLGEEDSKGSFDSEFPVLQVLDDIRNGGAPYILTLFGRPKTGKTAVASSYVRWAERLYGDTELTVASNMETFERNDECFTSHADLNDVIENNDTTAVVLDEAHVHLDGGRNESRAYVRDEFAPMLKKVGKRGVVLFVIIAHTGKDLHPECKRLSTHIGRKTDLRTLELYEDFDDGSHRLEGEHEVLTDLPAPPYDYDPNDMAPYSY
jgi:hypothetical protein